jgi:hypothetical protein
MSPVARVVLERQARVVQAVVLEVAPSVPLPVMAALEVRGVLPVAADKPQRLAVLVYPALLAAEGLAHVYRVTAT